MNYYYYFDLFLIIMFGCSVCLLVNELDKKAKEMRDEQEKAQGEHNTDHTEC